jgi:hypothetical protein
LSSRPTGPRRVYPRAAQSADPGARPEDRLQPGPTAEMDTGFRRYDKSRARVRVNPTRIAAFNQICFSIFVAAPDRVVDAHNAKQISALLSSRCRPGASRDPRQKWIPAFAGMTNHGTRLACGSIRPGLPRPIRFVFQFRCRTRQSCQCAQREANPGTTFFPSSSRRKPGPTAEIDTGLRRYDKSRARVRVDPTRIAASNQICFQFRCRTRQSCRCAQREANPGTAFFPLSSRRTPGPTAEMDTGFRRYDKSRDQARV